MVERQGDLTTQVGRLFIGEGTRAMLAIAEAMEATAGRGEEIPPELIGALQESAEVVKTAIDHVLPVPSTGNKG